MIRRRQFLRATLPAIALTSAFWVLDRPREAFGQMERNGTVGIQNDAERQLFWSLLCTCGCPRETLGTCTCGFGHQRRTELRAELESGKSIEQIKSEYAQRFGSAALAVPPNTGSQRAVWIAPLLAILAGAGVVGFVLRRWVKPAGPGPTKEASGGEVPKEAARNDENKYDDKLDEELKALDRE